MTDILSLFAWGHDGCAGKFAFLERYSAATVFACPACGQHRVVQDDPEAHAAALADLAGALIGEADRIDAEAAAQCEPWTGMPRDAWVICPCASSGPVTAIAAREAIARVLDGGPGICALPRMIADRNLTPSERVAAFATTGYTCPANAGPPACCTTD